MNGLDWYKIKNDGEYDDDNDDDDDDMPYK